MVKQTTQNEIVIYNHKDFMQGVKYLTNCCKIIQKKDKFKFDGIYGIPRGGYQLALHLSHSLNLPFKEKNNITKKTIIVDEICDTGKTLKKYKDNFKCVLVSKYKGINCIDNLVSHKIYPNNAWIKFYWENDNDLKK